MRNFLFSAIAIAFGVLAPLVFGEILLRFLPVSTGLRVQPVNEASPVYRFLPGRDYVWSNGWDFNIVNRGQVNNAGFVNDLDYEAEETTPLLAVIGDSYVEAAMVPFPDTLHGRLAAAVKDRGRVYSFAASGAPLSQYLVWAQHAREVYRPDAMAFVVIGNDFDQSLLAYKRAPGFHYYRRDGGGALSLARVDYEPSRLRQIARLSALARYLVLHLNLLEAASWLEALLNGETQDFLGNVPRLVDSERVEASKSAVEAFFRDLPQAAGLAPRRILFVVDGVRYSDAHDPEAYFVKMRRYFLDRARSLGYGAIDMDQLFMPEHRAKGTRFEFPTDAHWNAAGHRMAFEAIVATDLLQETFGRPNGQ